MFGYLTTAASKIFATAPHVYSSQTSLFSTTLSLFDKGYPVSAEPSLDASSAGYLEDMYNSWLKDPGSVHSSWDAYFRHSVSKESAVKASLSLAAVPTAASSLSPQATEEQMNVQTIIRIYQERGHLAARTNPLEEMFDLSDKTTSLTEKFGKPPPEVIKDHKLDSSLWDKVFHLPLTTMIGGKGNQQLPLKEIIKRLELTYCRHIGIEYMHINEPEQRAFIREKFELPGTIGLKKPDKRLMLTRLARGVLFEAFLQKKWANEKRFGLEGCETLIPCVKAVIDESAKNGAEMAILGMAHRGRLNVLANVCRQNLHLIFAQFRGLPAEDEGAGDVKYHLGVFDRREHPATKKPFTTVLVANSSHLEMVNPVCAGRTRAEQFVRNDTNGDKVISIIMHGDAAFCSEGVVYETINLANLPDYHNGGTIHFVINNQVGFTTDPAYSRSSLYCTDVGKIVNAPIFHVNVDDPESAVYVAKVAAEFRNKFHKDVVVDLVSYRKHGHNEGDEPMFTQPLMYAKIKKTPNVLVKYSPVAVKEGVTTQAEIEAYQKEYEKIMEDELEQAQKQKTIKFVDWIDSPWPEKYYDKNNTKCDPTGVSMDIIEHIATKYSQPPPGEFQLHKALQRVLHLRQEMVKHQTADWAIGEALAIGTLLKEGHHVRFSGEDVQRGTFSHRHHVVFHQTKKLSYTYLTDLFPEQAKYIIANSPISECGVLGFEHGYSMANPEALVLWEAQFGDFANNGQAIFDCMIASGQWKWVRQCGLITLLPHGQEGQGPEHSSARVERYLQLSSDDSDYLPPDSPDYVVNQLRDINWIVANCTTPANLFHIWRRQVKLPFRKPLILCTPKSLLRHPDARSKFNEMKEGTEFQRLYPETGPASQDPSKVKKLVFCTGKVYYDFMKKIKEKHLEDKIAVARVEQICPFPYDLIQKEAQKYSNAQVAWGQEEHKNAGCWTYVEPRFETAFKGQRDIIYVGRAPSASTASGNKVQYQNEYQALMADLVKNCE